MTIHDQLKVQKIEIAKKDTLTKDIMYKSSNAFDRRRNLPPKKTIITGRSTYCISPSLVSPKKKKEKALLFQISVQSKKLLEIRRRE